MMHRASDRGGAAAPVVARKRLLGRLIFSLLGTAGAFAIRASAIPRVTATAANAVSTARTIRRFFGGERRRCRDGQNRKSDQ